MPQIPIQTDFSPVGGGSPITSIQGGGDVALEVVLDATTSADLNVTLLLQLPPYHPGNPTDPITVPATLTVPASADRASVVCSTKAVVSSVTAQVSASANGTTVDASLTITP